MSLKKDEWMNEWRMTKKKNEEKFMTNEVLRINA
jgi:hypothetical protein